MPSNRTKTAATDTAATDTAATDTAAETADAPSAEALAVIAPAGVDAADPADTASYVAALEAVVADDSDDVAAADGGADGAADAAAPALPAHVRAIDALLSPETLLEVTDAQGLQAVDQLGHPVDVLIVGDVFAHLSDDDVVAALGQLAQKARHFLLLRLEDVHAHAAFDATRDARLDIGWWKWQLLRTTGLNGRDDVELLLNQTFEGGETRWIVRERAGTAAAQGEVASDFREE